MRQSAPTHFGLLSPALWPAGTGTDRNKGRFWSAVVFFLFLLLDSSTQGQCPERCICKWKGGKETVDCVNATLSRVPALDTTTQVMDLSHNNLLKITENVFRDRNLYNLQKIFLQHCSINRMTGRCFEGITNLVELDLSWNLLTSIPGEALQDCRYLMTLSLRGNPIRQVPGDALSALAELQTLDLSQCQLSVVDSRAFLQMRQLRWIKLDNNLLAQLQPLADLPKGLRGITLHNNRWRCDCELRSFQEFLRNNSVAYDAEPMCSAPDRISGQRISDLSQQELACRPRVSPTSTYQEIFQGKNMSLVCTITATPMASVTWWYKGLLINNGSTMVSDIDMRLYYYKNIELGQGTLKSELILLRTNLDDNGTFQCIAENKAGQAVANFSLNVVIPVPPKPPQDVVEDGFQQEYIIAIGIAGVIVSILSTVIVILVAVKCRGLRRSRRRSLAESKIHLYQNSVNGSDMSTGEGSLRSVPSVQAGGSVTGDTWPIQPDTFPVSNGVPGEGDREHLVGPDLISHTRRAGSKKGRRKVIAVSTNQGSESGTEYRDLHYSESYHEGFSHLLSQGNRGILTEEKSNTCAESVEDGANLSVGQQKLSPPTPFADTKASKCCFARENPQNPDISNRSKQPEVLLNTNLVPPAISPLPPGPSSVSGLKPNKPLLPDTERSASLRRERSVKSDKWRFSTLPRKGIEQGQELSLQLLPPPPPELLPPALELLPPPPSFKSVHFSLGTGEQEEQAQDIPTEGLPTGPAGEPTSAVMLAPTVPPEDFSTPHCDTTLATSKVIPIKLRGRDELINSR